MNIPASGTDDDAKFSGLFIETRTAVLGYLLRRCPDPETAADLLSETYAVAWRRRDRLPEGNDARLWLFTVARNLLLNERRSETRRHQATQHLADAIRANGGVAHDDDNDATLQQVRDALDKIAAADREILTLTAWEGLSPSEIATVVGTTAGVVRVRLHRARRRLRAALPTHDVAAVRSAGEVPSRAQ